MHALRWFVGVVAVSVMGLAVMAPGAQAVEVDLGAHLNGSAAYPNATGFSEYERDATGRDVEVTLTHVVRLAGKRVSVFVAGQKIGTMLVSSTGRAHIDRDTDRGQFVPFASAGNKVAVRTGTGTLVASGTYFTEPDKD